MRVCVGWEGVIDTKGASICEVDILFEYHVTVYNSQRNNMHACILSDFRSSWQNFDFQHFTFRNWMEVYSILDILGPKKILVRFAKCPHFSESSVEGEHGIVFQFFPPPYHEV